MSTQDGAPGSLLAAQPSSMEAETPFLASPAWAEMAAQASSPQFMLETPFLSEYRSGDEIVDTRATAIRELLSDLLDPEFDEELEELIAGAEVEIERLGVGESPADSARAERMLEHWIEPVRFEAEALLDRMATAFEGEDLSLLGETELEAILDRFEPQESDFAPTFEGFGFIKKLYKKARKAASGAVALAKKGVAAAARVLPIGLILKRLTGLVRPLLKKVIAVALNKFPPELRPYIRKLAGKFVGEAETLESFPEESETAPASIDTRQIQVALDGEIANLLMAPTDIEAEDVLAEANAAATPVEVHALEDLDDARERFIRGIENLEQGQDPTPLVEEFVPAILPALKVGISIVGRPRVVRFLAGYLGRLIAPYVGPQITPVLSRAIVDAGLKLISLEAPEDAGRRLAAEAFAGIVEDAVGRVGQLPESDLEEDHLVEAAAYEGFQEAAGANLPMTVLNPASEHLETSRPLGTWVSMPRGRRVRYRKYSRIFPVTITPQAARAITTFGGGTLDRFLRDRLGQAGQVRGRLHLYQAVPGTRPSRIARAERAVGGLGRGGPAARAGLQPLTREAAGMLIGEPGLGSEFEQVALEQEGPLAVGDRLYYLEVPGVRPRERRSSEASVSFDLRSNEARLVIFVSESEAQQIASRLRRREPIGASLSALRRIFVPALRGVVKGRKPAPRVAGSPPESEDFIGRLVSPAASLRRIIASGIARWTGKALGGELARAPKRFIEATENEADGVSLVVRMSNHPAVATLAQLLGGRPGTAIRAIRSATQLQRALAGVPEVRIDIHPGYRRAE